MKWATSVRHLVLAAEACGRMAELPPSLVGLRVVQLWAVGEVLGPLQDLGTWESCGTAGRRTYSAGERSRYPSITANRYSPATVEIRRHVVAGA